MKTTKNHDKHYIYPAWLAPVNVRAVSSTRVSGNSKKPYDSFNFSYSTGDDPENVLQNINQLVSELNLPKKPIFLNQKHTNKVLLADDLDDKRSTRNIADACFTKTPDVICAVLTADCLPILVCDKRGTIVSAIHAGWKSLSTHIIENTIKELNTREDDLLAWLGPAIGKDAFIVGKDVYDEFKDHKINMEKAFLKYDSQFENKYKVNIYEIAKQILVNCKLNENNIYGGDFCTYTNSNDFFSYRRDGEKSGRMVHLIWLTKR